MDTNLIPYDMDRFLEKYTRFMTKNIYITSALSNHFLDQYQYLYQSLEKNQFLYHNNLKYKKIMDIKKEHKSLLKLHNQKYLNKKSKEFKEFFEKFSSLKELDSRLRQLILCEEEQLFVVQAKKIQPLVIGKIAYLLEHESYQATEILILVEEEDKKKELLLELQQNFLSSSFLIRNVKDYGVSLMDEEETLLDKSKKYDILFHYLTDILFLKKEAFQNFYQAFSNYIYLNKDYLEYETFKDYHNYMYKRKFLASHLSLKKFNEQEVRKRKVYLRTIQNESVKSKAEVDIANFLYLNSISYHYSFSTSTFYIMKDNKKIQIQYCSSKEPFGKEKNTDRDDIIYLYSSYTEKKTALEVLAYEFIKRRFVLEYVTDEVLYQKLKETTMDSYFSEFLGKYFLPILEVYEKKHSLKEMKLTEEQKRVFLDIYSYYEHYVQEKHFLTEHELFFRIQEDILKRSIRYCILVGDIPISCKIPTLKIVSDYPESELLKENIKLLYDYKQYLCQNQSLPILHAYQSKEELEQLTTAFIKENLNLINQEFSKSKKKIEVYLYSDQNRLHIYKNISVLCSDILDKETSSACFGFSSLKDMNLLIGDDRFSKLDKNTLVTRKKRAICCYEYLNMKIHSDLVLLPFLIADPYHEDIIRKNEYYHLKVMIYATLHKCRHKMILLCPNSRRQELKKIFGGISFQIIN